MNLNNENKKFIYLNISKIQKEEFNLIKYIANNKD